jgi:hypothetical protein
MHDAGYCFLSACLRCQSFTSVRFVGTTWSPLRRRGVCICRLFRNVVSPWPCTQKHAFVSRCIREVLILNMDNSKKLECNLTLPRPTESWILSTFWTSSSGAFSISPLQSNSVFSHPLVYYKWLRRCSRATYITRHFCRNNFARLPQAFTFP